METAVTKLETLFQKVESDLDYIRHRLEFEILKGLPDDLAPEENPVALLEEISVVKSRFKMLCMKMKKVFEEQRESIKCISAALVNTMKIVWVLKQRAGLERLPLSEEEQAAALELTVQLVVEEPSSSGSTGSASSEEEQ
ncbi:spindle and kinetochore-associated protein 2 isoform 1-T1 [Guaruba guarouba]